MNKIALFINNIRTSMNQTWIDIFLVISQISELPFILFN